MENTNTIDLTSGIYKNLQDALDAAPRQATILLDSKTYTERIVIEKSLFLIGKKNTCLKLDHNQVIIHGGVQVHFKNIKFEMMPNHDANILVSGGSLSCSSCQFISKDQVKNLFSNIWVEGASLFLSDSQVTTQANFIKIVNGEALKVINNHLTMKDGNVSIEAHGVDAISIKDNVITASVNFLRLTKAINFNFENNKIKFYNKQGIVQANFLVADGLAHGNDFNILKNTIEFNGEFNWIVSNSLSKNRKIIVAHNQVKGDAASKIHLNFDHLQGFLVIENNDLPKAKVGFLKCSELFLKSNVIQTLHVQELDLIMVHDNFFLEHITIENSKNVTLKTNTIKNEFSDCEALKFKGVDKLTFEQNHVKSVDHGILLLNSGDSIEVFINNNEFDSCRKRAINIASTLQKKYLKTEIHIVKNIFTNNDKALYIDDRNLKSCRVSANYFSENMMAIVVNGGKSTSYIEVSENYFDDSNQSIQLRYAQVCTLSNNELSDSKLSIRACDEILIKNNHFQPNPVNKGASSANEISVKPNGYLTVSNNTMLSKKVRQERKEVMDVFNISSYEKPSALKIFGNFPLVAPPKKLLFNKDNKASMTYPDPSLLSAIRYQLNSKNSLANMNIDAVLKSDFLKLREALEAMEKQVTDARIKTIISKVINQFHIEIFSGKETNDSYRFIVKSHETVEMLRLYMSLENKIDPVKKERIVDVMANYQTIFTKFLSKKEEDHQDKLSAQIRLLEDLLK